MLMTTLRLERVQTGLLLPCRQFQSNTFKIALFNGGSIIRLSGYDTPKESEEQSTALGECYILQDFLRGRTGEVKRWRGKQKNLLVRPSR